MRKIMFCGGGSAGHVMPNLAIIEDIHKQYEITYMGTDGIERDICKKNGIDFCGFHAVKLRRGKILSNLAIPFKLIRGVREAKEILRLVKPDLLFCKGGYVSIPAAIAAYRLHIPVITHESDMSLGVANRVIAPLCKNVLTAFPETAKSVKRGLCVGTPIRKSLQGFSKLQARQTFGLDMRPTILVFGGGSGSAKINGCLHEIVPALCKEFNVLHLCGKGNLILDNTYGYKQIEFCNNMGLAYACADFAVARCGANSAFELTALKIPTLFIPLDNKQTRGDQKQNALYFLSLGTCRVLEEGNLTPNTLRRAIYSLITDQSIPDALAKSSFQSANERIEQLIEQTVNQSLSNVKPLKNELSL